MTKKSFYSILLLVVLTGGPTKCYAQGKDSLSDCIVNTFKQITNAPQEKIYLHTDKPYYFQGDTIWIKGYLASAITHLTNSFSKYVYIELIDQRNEILERKKIERTKDGFLGFLALSNERREGNYYLRAYTKWMQNLPNDFLYTQNIQIHDSQTAFCHAVIQYEQSGKDQTAIIIFTHPDKSPYMNGFVNCVIRSQEIGNKYIVKRTDDKGAIRLSLPSVQNNKLMIEVTLEDGVLKHKQLFTVPPPQDYHVDFFPEGGDLILGRMQKIAFKAINTTGISEDVHGIILSEKGDTITSFKSDYAGMGVFLLSCDERAPFFVNVYNKDGNMKSYRLPMPITNKVSLTLNERKGKIRYQILRNENYNGANPAYLLVHVRGKVILAEKLSGEKSRGGIVDTSAFPEGVAHFILVDQGMNPLSERLAFVRKPDLKAAITNLNSIFTPRTPINLMLQVTDENNNLIKGNFSFSVTDGYSIIPDSLAENIRSYFLLSSDLKGYIENPGYYFLNPNVLTDAILDNLMMTQGWRRFDIGAMLKKNLPFNIYPIENGQYISGTVKNVFGKPISNSFIVAMAPKLRISRYVKTDTKGRFLLDGLRFPENTNFIIQAAKKSGLTNYELHVDKDIFPDAYNTHPFKFPENKKKQEFLGQLSEGYTIVNGEKIYQLQEVAIIGNKSRYEDYSAYNWDENKIEQTKSKTAIEIIRQMPGISISPKGDLYFSTTGGYMRSESEVARPQDKDRPMTFARNNPQLRPRVYLDNRQIQMSDLQQIKAEDIRYVNLIDPEVDRTLSSNTFEEKGDDAQWNESLLEEEEEDGNIVSVRGRSLSDQLNMPAAGRIMLTSKSGNLALKDMSNLQITDLIPLGYTQYVEFYTPQYLVPQKKNGESLDIRSTIYWQPTLNLDGQTPLKVSFYASDRMGFYNYVLEGITENGQVYYNSGLLK